MPRRVPRPKTPVSRKLPESRCLSTANQQRTGASAGGASVSFYFHIPFCERKCGYCDFYSVESLRGVVRYFDCCGRELNDHLSRFASGKVDSIYFGGGTPSLVHPSHLRKLITQVRTWAGDLSGTEMTIEANPGSLDRRKLACWKEAGLNRISLGIQSFQDSILQTLERMHNAAMAIRSFEQARQMGWANIGIDLIFGVPRQTVAAWRKDLEKAVQLRPQHISAYGLSLAPGVPLHALVQNGDLRLPRPESYNQLFRLAHSVLTKAGYEHYEISNYALPGFRSRHNSRYWDRGDCIGIGAAAHSLLGERRRANVSNITQYCQAILAKRPPWGREESVTQCDRINEEIMLGLRTADGLDLKKIAGLGYCPAPEILRDLNREGLTRVNDNRLCLTLSGMVVSDEIIQRLFAEND